MPGMYGSAGAHPYNPRRESTSAKLIPMTRTFTRTSPAFGTGVGGFPLDDAARIEVEEVRRHLDTGSRLERVVFAVHGDAARRAFEAALD